MIIDAHYHLDPRLESMDRLLAQMREHRIDRVALIATACDPLRIGGVGRRFAQAMRRALAGAAPRVGRPLYRSTVQRSGRVSFLGPKAALYRAAANDGVEPACMCLP